MKARILCVFLLTTSFIFFFSSCCSDPKNCAAGKDAAIGDLPYQAGQQLTFSDSLGNEIILRLNPQIESSEAYEIGKKCGLMRKLEDCNSSITLSAQVITDNAGLILPQYRSFQCALRKYEDGMSKDISYDLNAFGKGCYIRNPGTENKVIMDGIKLSEYKTPDKIYYNAYISPLDTPYYYYSSLMSHGRIVYTDNGQMIAFSLTQDSSHYFYLKE